MDRSGREARAPRRMHLRARIWSLVVAATMALVSTTTVDASADGSGKVVVGEVSSSVGQEDAVPVLRTALVSELAKVKLPSDKSGKTYVVSAALTKLETKTSGANVTSSCAVSLVLVDGNGTMRAVVQGTSAGSGKAGDPTLRKALLEAAVRGATKGLPGVVTS